MDLKKIDRLFNDKQNLGELIKHNILIIINFINRTYLLFRILTVKKKLLLVYET